ncbi:hypothetical protein ACSBR1_025998 [Camellia fascicularis]
MAGGSDDYVQYELNDWVQRRSFEHPELFESKSVTKQGEQSTVQQMTSRAKHEDKTTGSYERTLYCKAVNVKWAPGCGEIWASWFQGCAAEECDPEDW